jgi:hypothetical protein
MPLKGEVAGIAALQSRAPTMRLNLHVITVVLPFVAASAVEAHASNLDYILVNNTDQAIVRIWVSKTTSSDWNESTNVYVAAGGRQQQTFSFSGSDESCYYDIRLQFKDGEFWNVDHVSLCTTSTLSIDADKNGKVVYEAK